MAQDSNSSSATPNQNDRHRRRALIWLGAALLIALPALAMQVTSEVNWDFKDFAVFAAMVCIGAAALDYILSRVKRVQLRILGVIAVISAFLLLWAQLAVQLVG